MRRGGLLVIGAALALPAAACAQPLPAWTSSGKAGAVSDYRYRGYSLSGGDPAAQAEFTLSHRSGFYGDAYLSSIEEYGAGADSKGAKAEATLTAGWAGSRAGFDIDAGISAYLYPGGSDVSYAEIPVQVGQTYGPLTWTLGAAYAPAQSALGDRGNGYAWGALDYALRGAPLTLGARIGYEDGAYAPGGKTDWAFDMKAAFGRAEFGLAWIDSDADKGALVGRLFVSF